MNKKEIKKTLAKLLEDANNLLLDFEALLEDVQETCDSIEPYENKWELTPQQEERKEWLESLAYEIEEVTNYLDLSSLEDFIY